MDNIFICDKCGKEFKYKKSLIYHQNKKIPCDNNNNDKYKCNYCNKELSKTTKINKHLKTCKIYNEYELKQEKKNNNKELKILNNKVKEIEFFVEEQKNINEEQKNINEEQNNKINELKKEIEILKNKNNKINKEVNMLKKIIKKEKNKENKNVYDKIKISKEDRIRYLKSNLNIYELVVDKFIKTYYVNEKKPENHLLYITDKNRNKIKYYEGNKWLDGDKRIILRKVMRNCIIQILNIDKNDKEEIKLENDIWRYTSEEAIDLFYLRSAFSLTLNEREEECNRIYNTILSIMSSAIYNGKTMIGKSIQEDKNIKKIIKLNNIKVDKLRENEIINEDKIENIELDLGYLCN
jgi:hypothetical protein